MSESQTLKMMMHETAHSMLHDSFGYIAGWSTGRDMKELKSSLDTICRTASELITGIEEQLREIQRDREMMQEQEKEDTEQANIFQIIFIEKLTLFFKILIIKPRV